MTLLLYILLTCFSLRASFFFVQMNCGTYVVSCGAPPLLDVYYTEGGLHEQTPVRTMRVPLVVPHEETMIVYVIQPVTIHNSQHNDEPDQERWDW